MSSARSAKRPTGFRRLERWIVGVGMSVIAFVLERIVLRSVKKKEPQVVAPKPTTLTSKGGEVDLDDLMG
jgi:hypothetical protein